jgi:hypothetical protein
MKIRSEDEAGIAQQDTISNGINGELNNLVISQWILAVLHGM